MKNVYTSWNLDLLADTLIEKIIKNWTKPLSSPAVVFTDPKTEQWFKLHWLKSKGAGNSILMNLKTLRIQQFLFDLVSPQAALQSGEIDILSVELLRDLLITKLTEKSDDGKYYFESLSSPEVTAYLTSQESTSKINANHLYDFAQTIASLFLDYEDTRPDSLNEVLSLESWQQKLYKDLIKEEGIEIEGTKYLTLFQLVKQNQKANGGELSFNWPKDCPVFIFGFTGIGQIYRNILEDFSKTSQLEIFLQLEDSKDAKNQFLQNWSSFGKDQFDLWTKDSHVETLDSAQAFSKNDSLLHRIQKSIAENKEFTQEEYDSSDTSITLTGAPTRLREIEALHTKVCKLLSQKNDTQLGDILVLAPKIQDYKTAIEQIFDQNDQFTNDTNFPYLPYTIADYSGERSLTAEALSVLFGILKKKYLSRSDLFALLHNYLVQTVRGITDEEVSDWADWASKLNIYRDRKNHEEWEKAKKRLLLSRLTSDTAEIDGDRFQPFESMTTADSNSLNKFIQVVDELKEWASYSEKEKFTVEDISQLELLLKNWLLLNGNIPEDLYNESLVFQNVVEEIERQRLTARPEVFADCFTNALYDRSAAVTLHSSNILTKGITFANFESNRILSAKYIFFIGLDSKTFPGLDQENELDLRKQKKPLPGDESIPERNKNAFLCQLMAAREGLFFSYVNKNIQKDEDFFKSSVLGKLFQTVYIPGFDEENKPKLENTDYEKHIKIDEDRPWQELFTPREFRNKKNFIALQNSGNDENNGKDENKPDQDSLEKKQKEAAADQSKNKNTPALPDRINISDMRKYLQEPFSFYVNQKLTSDYDDEEKEALELEPLSLGNKLCSDIRKTYVQSALQGKNDITVEKITSDLQIQNALPDSYFGEKAIEEVFSQAQIVLDAANSTNLDFSNFEFSDKNMRYIKGNDINPKDWLMSGELAWYNKDYSEKKEIITFELTSYKTVLTGYITSLLLLASLPPEDTEQYTITMYDDTFDYYHTSANISSYTYNATAEEARKLLNEIYNSMYISKFHDCIPLSLLTADIEASLTEDYEPYQFTVFKSDLQNDNISKEWAYFSKKDYFDVDRDLGYTEDNFETKWPAAKIHQMTLMKFLVTIANAITEVGE